MLDSRLAVATAREVGVGVGIYRADGEFAWVNDTYASMLGYEQEDLIGRPVWTVNPEFEPDSMQEYWNSIPPGETRVYQGVHRRADGSDFPVEMVITRIDVGETGYHVGTIRDVSERHQAQTALRESQERFEQLASHTDQQFWMVDVDYERIIFLNRAARSFWGQYFEDEEDLLAVMLEAVHPADRDRFTEAAERVRRERVELEYRVRSPGNGEYRWFQLSAFPIRDERDRVYRVGGLASDITERKRVEKALRESEQRFRELAENSELQFWMSDADFQGTIFLNEVDRTFWADYFQDREDIAEALLERIHPEDREAFLQGVNDIHEGPVHAEVRVRTPEDTYKWFRVSGFPIEDERGEVYRLGGVVQDIDERKQQERRLQRADYILNATPDAVYYVDEHDVLRQVNRAALDMTGYAREELVGANIAGLIPEEDQERVAERLDDLKGADPPQTDTFELEILCADGSTITCENHLALLPPPGEDTGSVGILRDITARKERERELQRSRWMLHTVADVVYALDPRGRLVDINVREDGVFGYTQEEVESVLGRPVDDWLRPQDVQRAEQLMQELQEKPGSQRAKFEMELVTADGSRIVCENHMTVLQDESEREFRGTVGVLRDITERKELEEQLRRKALYDDLTDLPNRTLFLDRLRMACRSAESAEDGRFAVLYMDLDRFKVINESMGHHIGDELLRAVGQRLQDLVEPSDTVARLGGDDFALLLTDLEDHQEAVEETERITRALEQPFTLEGQKIFTRASTGIVLPKGRREDDPSVLLRDADIAMYRSKTKGERYVLFDPDMHAETQEEMKLEMDLQQSIDREELHVHYQPILRIEDQTLLGLEALIRWEHPRRGFLSPGTFLPLAKKIGFMADIDYWVLERACRDLRTWQQDPAGTDDLFVSVNTSPMQLADPAFMDHVTDVLDSTGLDPASLFLEITENAVVANPENAARVIDDLQQRGVNIVVDDFGTGYSSLSYLSSLPIDTLKIDRSFVFELESDGDNGASRRIIRAIMNLARGLRTDVIAEGIETAAQSKTLQSLDCSIGQGFYYSQPMAADEVLDYIRSL